MSIDLRLPNINADTQEGKMAQLQSYMYQLVSQLNWALNAVTSAQNGDASNIVLNGSQSGSNPIDAQSTFNAIKSLIIKSADIVEAYSETIKKRFEGVYVADSDFGTYKNETAQTIETNSSSITNIYQNIQTISSELGSISDTIISTNAWLKTGLLGYDSQSIPIYGVEVGQRSVESGVEVFNKYARFTSGGIYFFLPGVSDAVAWMTGTKLYITNAEITGTLKVGSYICDFTTGVAFKWTGGGS